MSCILGDVHVTSREVAWSELGPALGEWTWDVAHGDGLATTGSLHVSCGSRYYSSFDNSSRWSRWLNTTTLIKKKQAKPQKRYLGMILHDDRGKWAQNQHFLQTETNQTKNKKKRTNSHPYDWKMARLHVCVALLCWFLSRKLSGAHHKNSKSKSKYGNNFMHLSLRKPVKIHAKHKVNESCGVNEQHCSVRWPPRGRPNCSGSKLSKFKIIITFEHFFFNQTHEIPSRVLHLAQNKWTDLFL